MDLCDSSFSLLWDGCNRLNPNPANFSIIMEKRPHVTLMIKEFMQRGRKRKREKMQSCDYKTSQTIMMLDNQTKTCKVYSPINFPLNPGKAGRSQAASCFVYLCFFVCTSSCCVRVFDCSSIHLGSSLIAQNYRKHQQNAFW